MNLTTFISNLKRHFATSATFFSIFTLILIPVILSGTARAQSSNAVPVQFFYIPIPEDQLFQVLTTVQAGQGTPVSNPMQTYISVAALASNTVIYYDQWENGFEPDIANPLNLYSNSNPGGTQIWGDGNPANGAPPGIPSDIINAGTVIVLSNPVNSNNRLAIDFDGGDKIAASKPSQSPARVGEQVQTPCSQPQMKHSTLTTGEQILYHPLVKTCLFRSTTEFLTTPVSP
ncbi:hypothetical protein MASR1M107_26100 [Ignavibacteriales bacterium]